MGGGQHRGAKYVETSMACITWGPQPQWGREIPRSPVGLIRALHRTNKTLCVRCASITSRGNNRFIFTKLFQKLERFSFWTTVLYMHAITSRSNGSIELRSMSRHVAMATERTAVRGCDIEIYVHSFERHISQPTCSDSFNLKPTSVYVSHHFKALYKFCINIAIIITNKKHKPILYTIISCSLALRGGKTV